MIIVGAKCECCGRVETMPYMDETTATVMFRQKGWQIEDKKTICRVCAIELSSKKDGKN